MKREAGLTMLFRAKGPVKLTEWVNMAVFSCYIKTVPVYDFKRVWVVLHLPVKEFFKTIYQQEENNDVLFRVLLADLEISVIHSTS